jgi:hypothetical protein
MEASPSAPDHLEHFVAFALHQAGRERFEVQTGLAPARLTGEEHNDLLGSRATGYAGRR